MNKIIFQIGALAFFVSLVAFSMEKYSLLDTVARAFIVFIAVIVALMTLLVLSVYVVSREARPEKGEHRPAAKAPQTAA